MTTSAPRARNPAHRGRAARHQAQHIDWVRTLCAKADAPLTRTHLRYRRAPAGAAILHCLLIDCSASMLRGDRLALAKGLLLAWVKRIYRRRESLAVITFSGARAQVLQTPRKALAFNERWIAPIAGGGGTPAASAVALADRLLAHRRRTTPGEHIALWLLSDVRFSVMPPAPRHADHSTVIDFDDGPTALGRARRLAHSWGADCVPAVHPNVLPRTAQTRFP